jgi:DNA polymerase III subunit epsilon
MPRPLPGARPGRLERLVDRLLRRDRPPDPHHYPAGPLRDLAAAPAPDARTPVREARLLVLDLETTGLDPRADHVLTAGWVPVVGLQVVLAGAREVAARPPVGAEVGHSATIHGLTDDAVASAPAVRDVLPDLLGALHGHVLVAHHAGFDLAFLDRATEAAYGARAPLTVVDTLALQHRLVRDPHGHVREGALRLDASRRRFGLPRHGVHRALGDAVATAELLLAQVAELEHRLGRPAVLGDLGATRRP